MKNFIWGLAVGVLLGVLLWILLKPLAIILLVGLAVIGAYALYNAGKQSSDRVKERKAP